MKRALLLSFGAQIVAALSVLILNLLVGRTFGAEGTGLFFETLMFVMVASVIARVGMDNVLTRHISVAYSKNNKNHALQILRVANHAGLIASAVAVLLVLTVYWMLKGGLGINALVLFAIPFVVLTALHSSGLRGMGRAWAYPLVGQGVGPLFVTLIVILYWAFDRSTTISQLLLFYLLGSVVAFLLARLLWNIGVAKLTSQHDVSLERLEFTWSKMWISCRHSFPVSVLNLAVFPWAGILFLSFYGTLSDVGLYAVAERLVQQIRWIVTSVGNVVAPKFSVLHEQGNLIELERLARRSGLLISVVVLPIIAMLYIFGEAVLSLFGSEFVRGAPVMGILLIGGLVHAITSNAGMLLTMTGHEKGTKHSLYASALALLLCMGLLVPLLGAIGAAISYSAAIIIQNVLLAYHVKKRLGISSMPGIGGKFD